MPAKAGVGASTIAANATWAFCERPDTNVLLADFDMASGVTEFMFDTKHDHNLADAAMRGKELDDDSWQRLVKKVGKTDLLLSALRAWEKGFRACKSLNWSEFARRNYKVVSADVPDTLDETTLAVLREANRIFLVTTPELPALRLARLKILLLQTLNLHDKVSPWSIGFRATWN